MSPKNTGKPSETEENIGVEIFKKAMVFQLTEQMRARGCEKQARLVELLRRRVENPIDDEVLSLVKHLSAVDARDDPKWKEPTFLVGSNRERKALNCVMMEKFAKDNNRPILQYDFLSVSFNAQSGPSERIIRDFSEGGRGKFVEGAPVMITQNVKTSAGIANGVRGRMIGFVYKDQAKQQSVLQRLRLGSAGEVIREDRAPDYLIVEFEANEKYNAVPTMIPGRRVVPVTLQAIDEILELPGGTERQNKVAWMAFPVEVAFSITFHKCQGLTLERVVICAPKRVGKGGAALTYEMMLVALTRTTMNDHVRFMPSKSGTDMSHLKGLKSSKEVIEYFNGEFDPITHQRKFPKTR